MGPAEPLDGSETDGTTTQSADKNAENRRNTTRGHPKFPEKYPEIRRQLNSAHVQR